MAIILPSSDTRLFNSLLNDLKHVGKRYPGLISDLRPDPKNLSVQLTLHGTPTDRETVQFRIERQNVAAYTAGYRRHVLSPFSLLEHWVRKRLVWQQEQQEQQDDHAGSSDPD